jgi:hypothetical protein
MEEENVEVIKLFYSDEEVDRQMEEKIDEVVKLLYADEKPDRRLERLPDGMQSGMHHLIGKIKGLRFRAALGAQRPEDHSMMGKRNGKITPRT